MNFARGTIKSSPYVGVFCSPTEEVALVPYSIHPKELHTIEQKLEVNAIKTTLGNSNLLGVLSKGLGRKYAVTSLAEKEEVRNLERNGLELILLEENFTATGNLAAMNKNGGIASPLFSGETISELKKFFGVKFEKMMLAGSDLAGACLTVTNKGFICHPNTSEKDFRKLEKTFKVRGVATTANFGDLFVGNSVIANSKGAMAGERTSGVELSKIDEGLRGD